MKKINSLWLVFILLMLLAGCTAPAAAPVETPAPAQPAANDPTAAPAAVGGQIPVLPTDALFQVVKPDGSAVAFTVADLKKLPLAQLKAEGKVEEGPRIADVLQAAGVTDYNEIEIKGSSTDAVLTRQQVGETSMLDFTNHGTVKLATEAIPKADWTKDVSLIVVK